MGCSLQHAVALKHTLPCSKQASCWGQHSVHIGFASQGVPGNWICHYCRCDKCNTCRLVPLPCCAACRGVVAVELGAADEARSLLRQYLDTKQFGEGSGKDAHSCWWLSFEDVVERGSVLQAMGVCSTTAQDIQQQKGGYYSRAKGAGTVWTANKRTKHKYAWKAQANPTCAAPAGHSPSAGINLSQLCPTVPIAYACAAAQSLCAQVSHGRMRWLCPGCMLCSC